MVTADELIAYESDELSEDEVVDLFQRLVDNGMAWSLQGHYGRTAESLIQAGLVRLPSIKKGDADAAEGEEAE